MNPKAHGDFQNFSKKSFNPRFLIVLIFFSLFAGSAFAQTCVDMPALLGYIGEWKAGTMDMPALLGYIGDWKTGANCPLGVAQITASRVSCTAPCAVFFDAIGSLSWQQIEEHEFLWDFGNGTETDLSSGGKNFTGYMAAHVFETPGTYNVNLTMKKNHAVVDTANVQIDVQQFTGRTICVSQTGAFADCPSGSTADHFANFASAWSAIATNTKMLLNRGETFDLSAGVPAKSVAGPVIIGAYGTGAKPLIDLGYGSSNSISTNAANWVYSDLHITGGKSPFGGFGEHKLILRVDVEKTSGATFGLGNGDAKEQFVFDSSSTDKYDEGGTTGQGGNGVYTGGASTMVVVNSLIDNNYKGEHNFRSYTSNRILIANSTFIRPKRTKASVILSAAAGGHTQYGLISNLTFDGAISLTHEGGVTDATVTKVIVEKSKLLKTNNPDSVDGKYALGTANDFLPTSEIVLRNNVGIQAGTMFSIGNIDNVKIYGNTYYESDPLSGGRVIDSGLLAKTMTFKNNLAYIESLQDQDFIPHFFRSKSEYTYTTSDYGYYYAPHHQNDFSAYFNGVNAYMTLPAWQTATGNDMHSKRLTATEANNLFVNPAGADGIINTLDDDLSLKAGSIAIDKGEAMPGLFEDHKGNPRDATPDIGAFEYQ